MFIMMSSNFAILFFNYLHGEIDTTFAVGIFIVFIEFFTV